MGLKALASPVVALIPSDKEVLCGAALRDTGRVIRFIAANADRLMYEPLPDVSIYRDVNQKWH